MSRDAELRGGETFEPMIAELKARMLTGDEQMRRLAEFGEGMGDWA